jgi:hypothetical protein
MSDEDLKAELERLRSENAVLKRSAMWLLVTSEAKGRKRWLKLTNV